jgi:hypothetical protein
MKDKSEHLYVAQGNGSHEPEYFKATIDETLNGRLLHHVLVS